MTTYVRPSIILLFTLALAAPMLAGATLADDACYPAHVACNDAAQKLPGSVYQKDSPFYKAWRACFQATEDCKAAFNAKNNPPKPELKPKPQISGEVVSVKGEVEVSTDGGKTFKPWAKGTSLKYGDYVMTSFESTATIKFPYGEIEVWPITQLRIDEYVAKENLQKTQLYLRLGVVAAKVKHTAAIRSDFSVTTPAAVASIRGSAMKVAHDEKLGTTIEAVEGNTYWKKIGGAESALLEGTSLRVGLNGTVITLKSPNVVQTPGKPSNVTLPGNMPSSGGCATYPAKKQGKRLPAIISADNAVNGASVCKANDGNEKTWWIASKEAHPKNNISWVQLDLGSIQNVGVLKWKGVAWDKESYPGASPTHFTVESSNDGKAWEQVNEFGYNKKIEKKDQPMIIGNIYLVKRGGGQLKARYLRLTTSQVNDGTGWSLGLKEIWVE